MKWGTAVIIFLAIAVPISAQELVFNSEGTQIFYLNLTQPDIAELRFDIEGISHSSSYPSNVTVGINSEIEWRYEAYHTENPMNISSLRYMQSSNSNPSQISAIAGTPHPGQGIELGSIQNNIFHRTQNLAQGQLGIYTTDAISSQIISISHDNTTTHAFLPEQNQSFMLGYYVAQGGSTYYCNSGANHTECNLTVIEAMAPQYLARQAQSNFSHKEHVRILNLSFEGCTIPCEIAISVRSESPGIINITDIMEVPNPEPSDITITQNATHNLITIANTTALEYTGYFYGKRPTVYMVPFVADDASMLLTPQQQARYDLLIDNLAESWDNITDGKLPIDFVFFDEPYRMFNLSSQDNYSQFLDSRTHWLNSRMPIADPSIIVTIDINDQFSSVKHHTVKHGNWDIHIAEIYMNGFNHSPMTYLTYWNSEILLNFMLHELGHAFIHYPPYESQKRIYVAHPASFTDRPDIIAYNTSQSPTGAEAHYDIFSIMSNARPLIAKANISNIPPMLTALDRMQMQILSPYAKGNFTLYNGNISRRGPQFYAENITQSSFIYDAGEMSRNTPADSFWHPLSHNNHTDMDSSQEFAVERMPGHALWIIAESLSTPGHFIASAADASSTVSFASPDYYSYTPEVSLISPANSSTHSSSSTVAFTYNASSDVPIYNCSLFINSVFAVADSGVAPGTIRTISRSLSNGDYIWTLSCKDHSNRTFNSSEYSLKVSYTPPSAPSSGGGGGGGGGGSARLPIAQPVNNTTHHDQPTENITAYTIEEEHLNATIEETEKDELAFHESTSNALSEEREHKSSPPAITGNVVASDGQRIDPVGIFIIFVIITLGTAAIYIWKHEKSAKTISAPKAIPKTAKKPKAATKKAKKKI